jgi:DNA-binding transcriptional regulator LsrR (DeoR family)
MLLAAARLYYLQGRSQAEVADALGTSRSNVSRMLTEALRQSIVEIRINDPEGRVHELEDELSSTFGLNQVRVAHTRLVPGLRVEDAVGRLASRLLLDELKDSMTVALSWGRALQAMVYATTADHEFHRLTLTQLVGGLSSISNEISGQELVRELAVRLGAEYRFLHAPATLESTTSRHALMAEPSISAALAEAGRADVAFVGIGTPTHGSSAAILDSLNLDASEQDEFWAHEPVGDVAARYYNAQGTPIRGVVDDRVLGITLEGLLEIPNVVGVASGRAKTPGLLGALRGRIIDSLVCDEALARSVLSAAGSSTPEGTHP